MSTSSTASVEPTPIAIRIVEYPAVIVLIVMMLHVTANALARAVWDSPIQNTIELVQFVYLPIIAALGFIAAQLRSEHIVADIAVAHLSVSVRRWVLTGGYLLSAVVMGGFAWFGFPKAIDAQAISKTAGVSTIPVWPIYYLVAAALAVLTVLFLRSAYRAFRGHEDLHEETAEEMVNHTLEEIQ